MIDHFALLKSSSTAFFSTLFCTWLLRPLACHIGLVDSPGGRKWHKNDVPLIGGIAMFFGFCFALLMLPFSINDYRGLLAGSGLLILIGVADDFHDISSKLRLIGQFIACFFLIFWGHKVSNLGNLFFLGDIHLGRFSFALTTVAILAFINAINMIDGQDGLAGGVALTQTLFLLFLSILLGNVKDTALLSILTVLLSAFLLFNVPLPWQRKTTVFLGDAGSTFIAFVIAWFAISLSQENTHYIKPMTILWILALPLFDMISVCTFRLSKGVSPFSAGRDHLHHILHMHGVTTSLSTFLLCLISTIFGLVGLSLTLFQLNESWFCIAYFVTMACYLLLVKLARQP